MNQHQDTPTDLDLALTPIYGPSDSRWGTLAEWLLENFDDRTGLIDELTPSERALWFEGKLLGKPIDYTADLAYPTVPEALLSEPVWAASRSEESIDAVTEHPAVVWGAEIASARGFDCTVNLERADVFDPELVKVTAGATIAQLWLGGNVCESGGETTDLDSPEKLREMGRTLIAAADQWESLTAADEVE